MGTDGRNALAADTAAERATAGGGAPRTLAELEMGDSAVVTAVGGSGALRQHFLDMGVIPGVDVTFVKKAPMGDPLEFRIHDYELTLRAADAAQIQIEGPAADGQPRQPHVKPT